MGKIALTTDEKGRQISYKYDDLGNLIKIVYADSTSVSFTYDNEGNNLTATDRLGRTVKMEYDKVGNLLSKTYPNGVVVRYNYNKNYELISTVSASGSETKYEYDRIGRNTAIIDALDHRTEFTYNSHSQLESMTDAKGYTYTYTYYDCGNRSAVKYANRIVISYNYDELNRLISEKALDKQGGLVAKYEYTLGAAGERLKAEETDRTVEYTYDKLYRLTGEKITAGDEVTEYTYAYDSVSNRITKTRNSAETTYTYNALNQLTSENGTSYQYDDAGNLISVTSDTKSVLYAYNAENKMIRVTVQEGSSVSVEEYEYDYAGNRTVKKSENNYTYYLNDVSGSLTQVIAELDADGNEKCWYTIGADLISQERSGTVSTYLYDGHGSVRGLSDETGAVTDTYNYDAWGELLDKTGTTENSFLYCGEQLDSATGLYYLRARYMDPSTGVFTTMDTYQGSIFDPVSLHKYLYANADPVMNSDPSGYATLTGTQVAVLGATFIAAAIASNSTWAMNVYKNIRSSFVANSYFVPKYIFQIDDIFIMQIASGLLTSADANDEVSSEITSGATSGTGAASPDPKNNKNKKNKKKNNNKGNNEHNGTQTPSTSTWKNGPTERIDVENPNPGKRPGNIHYHDANNNKYYYDIDNNTWEGLSKSQLKKLNKIPGFQRGLEKAIKMLGV